MKRKQSKNSLDKAIKDIQKAAIEHDRIVEIVNAVLHTRESNAQAKLDVNKPTNTLKTANEAPSRQTILDTAKGLVYGPRNKVYRHPADNFNNIANLFNAYFEAIKVRPTVFTNLAGDPEFRINNIDVAYLNILQKIARGATAQDHEDTIVDIAGYAACIERILKSI